MTVFDDQDVILAEYTAHGPAVVSCLTRSIFFKREDEGCVDIAFSSEQRCVFDEPQEFFLIMVSEPDGLESRETYLPYIIKIDYSAKTVRHCSGKEGTQVVG